MWLQALVVGVVSTIVYLIVEAGINLFRNESNTPAVWQSAIGNLVVQTLAWRLAFFMWPRPFIWSNIYLMILACAIIAAIISGAVGTRQNEYGDDDYNYSGTAGLVVVIVVWGLFGAIGNYYAINSGNASALADRVQVTNEPVGTYPETDSEHIPIVPEQAARFKANQAISENTGTDGVPSGLSTKYDLGDVVMQSVGGKLVYVVDLRVNHLGFPRFSNDERNTVPCYITVDAEDPNAKGQLHCGYKMVLNPNGAGSHSMRRYLQREFPGYTIQDVTIEIKDDGTPTYTAALSKPAYRYGTSVPVKMVVVDPQARTNTVYELDEVPTYVDRVYSAEVAIAEMGWWGKWDKAKFQRVRENKTDRYEVSDGIANLVYLKGSDHPVWQILMTDFTEKTAINYVALYDARTGDVRLYTVSGVQKESEVKKTVVDAAQNQVHHVPVHMTLHRIRGVFAWVAPMVAKEEEQSASIQRYMIVGAESTQGTNIQFANTLEELYLNWDKWLTNNLSTAAPGEDSETKTISGTVSNMAQSNIAGNTVYFIIVETTDGQELSFKGQYDEKKTELPFVKTGSTVTITYLDTGTALMLMTDIDVGEVSLK